MQCYRNVVALTQPHHSSTHTIILQKLSYCKTMNHTNNGNVHWNNNSNGIFIYFTFHVCGFKVLLLLLKSYYWFQTFVLSHTTAQTVKSKYTSGYNIRTTG